MCGINGILYMRGAGHDRPEEHHSGLVRRMNEAIAHRGPDGEGIFICYPMCLGHRRLSIIDLSDNGAQPMFNEDRSIAIVFNGEIYNYLELIPDLVSKGHSFRSKSDTEVIIHAYEEYGPACVSRFNGMWAFVIYDFKKQMLFASRDRFGVKPFYYSHDDDQFVFSSEIKAILQIKPVEEANLGKLYDYLAYGYKTNNGETFFKGIHELKAGHNLTIKNEKLETWEYWTLGQGKDNDLVNASLDELADKFTALLVDSVRLRFRSDVPVAILLSGGLDSTSIARVVDDLIDKGVLDYTEVKAYTALFPGYVYDESGNVREFMKTSKHIQLQEVFPDGAKLVSSFADIVYGLGEPVFNATSFAHYSLMKEIHNDGTKVVINGQGSDEAFCGYDRYLIGYFLLDILHSKPDEFWRQLKAIHQELRYPYSYILAQCVKAILPRRASSYLRGKYQEGVIDCLSKEFVRDNYHYLQNSRSRIFASSNLDAYLKFNIHHYGFNQILHYEDHSSMQHSIEMRSPFVDYRIMEFAFSLPTKAKFDMGITKKVIREAFKKRLPASIVDNRLKIGFATPFDQWLDDEKLNSFVLDAIGSRSFLSKKIWDGQKIRKAFENSKQYPRFPYWRILNTELWSQAYGIKNL